MKKRGKIIYFGEELDDFKVEIREDTILINGRPLIPYSTLGSDEKSEYTLDDKTQKIVRESLDLVDPRSSFEENAEKVTNYLREKGLSVKRGKFYGDVLLETGEGWGVVVFFNEEARIQIGKSLKEGEPGKSGKIPSGLEEIFKEGLVIVDEGFLSFFPGKEAEEIVEELEKIYVSQEDSPTKIKKIQELLKIPEESARKLLMQHKGSV